MTTRSLHRPHFGRVVLHCARPNCTCRFQSRRFTVRRARAIAARYGWTLIGRVDLCECCTLRAARAAGDTS
jgi:hypothetical protein